MKKTSGLTMLAATIAAIALNGVVLAEGFTTPAQVQFSVDVDQKSVRDTTLNDAFKVSITDKQIKTSLKLDCQAGISAWAGIVRKDETCLVTGEGQVINPNNGSLLPRTKYKGGYTVQAKKDGYTETSSLQVNYLALGAIPPSSGSFGGAVHMLPENPAAGAVALKNLLLQQVKKAATGGNQLNVVDTIDSIKFENLSTPSAGFPSDKGCVWNGDMIYAYATQSWVMDLTARCGEQTVTLQGNMPWLDVEGEADHNAKYVLTLTVPSDGTNSDAGLFTTASSDNAMFASADGITGTIKMQQSGLVETEIEQGVFDEVATQIKATGEFTGNNVSQEVVRSFATVIGMFSRVFFGA